MFDSKAVHKIEEVATQVGNMDLLSSFVFVSALPALWAESHDAVSGSEEPRAEVPPPAPFEVPPPAPFAFLLTYTGETVSKSSCRC